MASIYPQIVWRDFSAIFTQFSRLGPDGKGDGRAKKFGTFMVPDLIVVVYKCYNSRAKTLQAAAVLNSVHFSQFLVESVALLSDNEALCLVLDTWWQRHLHS